MLFLGSSTYISSGFGVATLKLFAVWSPPAMSHPPRPPGASYRMKTVNNYLLTRKIYEHLSLEVARPSS